VILHHPILCSAKYTYGQQRHREHTQDIRRCGKDDEQSQRQIQNGSAGYAGQNQSKRYCNGEETDRAKNKDTHKDSHTIQGQATAASSAAFANKNRQPARNSD